MKNVPMRPVSAEEMRGVEGGASVIGPLIAAGIMVAQIILPGIAPFYLPFEQD